MLPDLYKADHPLELVGCPLALDTGGAPGVSLPRFSGVPLNFLLCHLGSLQKSSPKCCKVSSHTITGIQVAGCLVDW